MELTLQEPWQALHMALEQRRELFQFVYWIAMEVEAVLELSRVLTG
jgi:hypothetical protein